MVYTARRNTAFVRRLSLFEIHGRTAKGSRSTDKTA
jgi:hypothetical protein